MKPKHVFIAVLCTGLIAAASCKKEDKEKPKTTAERIQAKWLIDTYTLHAHGDNVGSTGDTSVTYPGATSDYFEFHSGNNFYVNFLQQSDSLTYSLQDDSTLLINGFGLVYAENGTYRIRNLSDNTMTLYTKENDPSSPGDYVEVNFNLKK